MDLDLVIQNQKENNKKNSRKNSRPFSSNPLGKNNRIKSSKPRVKTGLTK